MPKDIATTANRIENFNKISVFEICICIIENHGSGHQQQILPTKKHQSLKKMIFLETDLFYF